MEDYLMMDRNDEVSGVIVLEGAHYPNCDCDDCLFLQCDEDIGESDVEEDVEELDEDPFVTDIEALVVYNLLRQCPRLRGLLPPEVTHLGELRRSDLAHLRQMSDNFGNHNAAAF